MSFNKLYGFLIRNSHGFQFLSTKDKLNFALYELDHKEIISLVDKENNEHELITHHISVYENQESKAYLSQYHYTAYFIDKRNKYYQLHVYFDEHDHLTMRPILALLNEEGDFTKLEVEEEFGTALIQLAVDHTSPKMRELRESQLQLSSEYENRYICLEKELAELSRDLMAHRDAYLEKTEEMIVVLNELVAIHVNDDYQDILRLFKKIKESMKLAQAVLISKVKQANTVAEKEILESESHTPIKKDEAPSTLKPLTESCD